nr:ribonuclease H-like domain-containing protein [Tanacetum cinerariifolium]
MSNSSASTSNRRGKAKTAQPWTTAEEITLCTAWCNAMDKYDTRDSMNKGFWSEVFANFEKEMRGLIENTISSSPYGNIQFVLKLLRLVSFTICFEEVYGLRVNYNKNKLYGIGVNERELSDMALWMGCSVGEIPFTYLDLPIGADMRRINSWNMVVDKFKMRVGEELEGLGLEFASNCKGVLGDQMDIRFWSDRWVGEHRLCDRFSRLYHLDRCYEGSVWEKGSWVNGVGSGIGRGILEVGAWGGDVWLREVSSSSPIQDFYPFKRNRRKYRHVQAKRQHTLSRFSAEAEYRGVANVVAETAWLHNLLRELHYPLSTTTLVYCENVSVVYMSANPVQHQRTKHIEIDIHFVRDMVTAGQHFITRVAEALMSDALVERKALGEVDGLVKDKQENDEIETKPDKNGKHGRARQCQILVTIKKAEKRRKYKFKGPNMQTLEVVLIQVKDKGWHCNYDKDEPQGPFLPSQQGLSMKVPVNHRDQKCKYQIVLTPTCVTI